MHRILVLVMLLVVGCSGQGAPKERALLGPYQGARVVQKVSADDGYGLLFTHSQNGASSVGVAFARKSGDTYQTHVQARAVERMQGLDTPLVLKTEGDAGALLFVAGLANHPAAARVEVRINGGPAQGASVSGGGYAIFTPAVTLKEIEIKLYDKAGHLVDRWPMSGVPAARKPRGGDAS